MISFQGVKKDCPEDTCPDNAEYIAWESHYRADERDMYLATSCLLAHALLLSICHYKSKFDRYVEFKL